MVPAVQSFPWVERCRACHLLAPFSHSTHTHSHAHTHQRQAKRAEAAARSEAQEDMQSLRTWEFLGAKDQGLWLLTEAQVRVDMHVGGGVASWSVCPLGA